MVEVAATVTGPSRRLADSDAGLMHRRQRHAGTGSGARYYDPQVGRFITRDTVLSEHPYFYCEHDPVNGVDPSGHGLGEDLMAAGAVVIAGGSCWWLWTTPPAAIAGSSLLICIGGIVAGIGGGYYLGTRIAECMDCGTAFLPPPSDREYRQWQRDVFALRRMGVAPTGHLPLVTGPPPSGAAVLSVPKV